jgi:hypothetical protein
MVAKNPAARKKEAAMQSFSISVLLALVLAAVLAGALFLYRSQDQPAAGAAEAELLALRRELAETRDRIAVLEETVDVLRARGVEARPAVEATPPEDGAGAAAPPAEPTVEQPESAAAAAAELRPQTEEFREYVFGLIGEERRLREELQRQRAEEYRRELEELKKGPYERFNTKVNSMAKVLNLSDGQRDRYYEVSKAYWDEMQELRRGTKWQDSDARKRFKEEQDQLQKDFALDVERILTAPQAELFRELPEWSRNVNHLGRVVGPDEKVEGRYNFKVNSAGGTIAPTVQVQVR